MKTTVTTGWWRRNAGWLAGALVLGALALWLPYRQARQEALTLHPDTPVRAAPGQWASFGGARWRLLAAEVVEPGDRRLRGWLRQDAVVLLLRYEVVRAPGADVTLFETCRGAVTDAAGRRWEAGPNALPRLAGPRLPTGCGNGLDANGNRVTIAPGQPLLFQHAFVLPRGQEVHGLHARIELSPQAGVSGHYLDVPL